MHSLAGAAPSSETRATTSDNASAGPAATATGGTETEPEEPPPPLRFVSSEWRAGREGRHAALPARRLPICFPTLTLQMLKLPPEQLEQLRETGWLREVAFRTTPEVTKLEIAAYLESVYGMSVERVNTINYLGRVRTAYGAGGKAYVYREDDWKKAYVTFRPPPGMEHLLEAATGGGAAAEGREQQQRPLLERIREAARAPRSPRRRLPWANKRPGQAGAGDGGPGGASE
ncbi:hypothetical protein GPECTOR_12g499 [Gonium pectorale]|uniref:Large ribosomal subunit protein uL23c n=1 Tax=Gonium pectorale TaxID=33097 RepID=A0A150GNV1_GONPE|nr:hypothetical protein GPECTOR_12g499 [Gonium pectorale]|eukprot:KXZ51536.1 hypothetical protein GPECTOR_12g499 [Gonium pectorale]